MNEQIIEFLRYHILEDREYTLVAVNELVKSHTSVVVHDGSDSYMLIKSLFISKVRKFAEGGCDFVSFYIFRKDGKLLALCLASDD